MLGLSWNLIKRYRVLIANAELLSHLKSECKLIFTSRCFRYYNWWSANSWKRNAALAFFSRKITRIECAYSVWNKELHAAYTGDKHFRHMLEAKCFTLFTNYKPLTYAFQERSDNHPSRQTISYILYLNLWPISTIKKNLKT